jgi:hypothetical protein
LSSSSYGITPVWPSGKALHLYLTVMQRSLVRIGQWAVYFCQCVFPNAQANNSRERGNLFALACTGNCFATELIIALRRREPKEPYMRGNQDGTQAQSEALWKVFFASCMLCRVSNSSLCPRDAMLNQIRQLASLLRVPIYHDSLPFPSRPHPLNAPTYPR